MTFNHSFPANYDRENLQRFIIHLDTASTPIQPAIHFRNYLEGMDGIVKLTEKMEIAPQIEDLIGAPHAYIWGGGPISQHDVMKGKWQSIAKTLLEIVTKESNGTSSALRNIITDEDLRIIKETASNDQPYKYLKREISRILSNIYLLDETLVKENFSTYLIDSEDWGNGISKKFVDNLSSYGFSHFLLATDGWEEVEYRPNVADYARTKGFVFGTYDSFHSIHNPIYAGTDRSWPTAQFGQELFELGAIINEDGEPRKGFKQFGYKLSPKTARPYVEKRVSDNFKKVNYSYYFVDADAYGEYYDDFRPNNRLSQRDDAEARIDRLRWIFETYNVPIGSEGGFYRFAPVLTVAEGVFIPVIGWGDPDMTNKESKYYKGRYYPPEEPEVFFKQVPLKDKYIKFFIDPRYRLPLYEVVFHDSVLTTAHWGYGSLKFSNIEKVVALTEMLYQVAPLYHLNLPTLDRIATKIKNRYDIFFETHSYSYKFPLEDFQYLSGDRRVQKTQFGNLVIVANFSNTSFDYGNIEINPLSAIALLNGKVL